MITYSKLHATRSDSETIVSDFQGEVAGNRQDAIVRGFNVPVMVFEEAEDELVEELVEA